MSNCANMPRFALEWSFILFTLVLETSAKTCMYPGHGIHTNTNMTTASIMYDSKVEYKCDPGFEMFGTQIRTCHLDGTWSGHQPICAINVALHRIVKKIPAFITTHSEEVSLDMLVDGFHSTCLVVTSTELMPCLWSIDLLQEQSITMIKLSFGEPIKERLFEVLYGNTSETGIPFPIHEDNFKNPHPFYVDSKEMAEYHLWVKYPIKTRYVTVKIPTQHHRRRISLCEVAVYSATASSSEQCKLPWVRGTSTDVHESSCYSFHHKQKKKWKEANMKCKTIHNGYLVSVVTEASQKFLAQTLKHLYHPLTQDHVFWVAGVNLKQYDDSKQDYWNRTTHRFENIADACMAISGPLGWNWTHKHCQTYNSWICEYAIPECGYPDQNPLSILDISLKPEGSRIAEYSCPEGYVVEGPAIRTCLPNGQWSDTAPRCRYVNCGQPDQIDNGTVILLQGVTTYGSAAEYSCWNGLHLSGIHTRVCQREGHWSGHVPSCTDVWPHAEGLTALLNLEIVLAVALACLGFVILAAVVILCIVFLKKRKQRKLDVPVNGFETKTFLARFDSEGDLERDSTTSDLLLNGYHNSNGTVNSPNIYNQM